MIEALKSAVKDELGKKLAAIERIEPDADAIEAALEEFQPSYSIDTTSLNIVFYRKKEDFEGAFRAISNLGYETQAELGYFLENNHTYCLFYKDLGPGKGNAEIFLMLHSYEKAPNESKGEDDVPF